MTNKKWNEKSSLNCTCLACWTLAATEWAWKMYSLILFILSIYFFLAFFFLLHSSISKVIFNDVLKITLLHLTANANNLISHFPWGAYALCSHFSNFHCIVGGAVVNPWRREQWQSAQHHRMPAYVCVCMHVCLIFAPCTLNMQRNFHYAPMKWLISTIF